MTTLAIIGIGRWGINYIDAIKSIKNVTLKYVCSTNIKILDKIPNNFTKLESYRELFKHKDIEGIIVATPASTHFRIAKDLLLKGYNVLIEKPFTTNYKDAAALKTIHEKTNSIVMIGHTYLYNPAFIKTKTLIKNIGEIKYLSCEGGNWGPIRKDVSVLWDWAPHDISMCLEVMKSDPVLIQAWGVNVLQPQKKNVFDIASIRLVFSHNIQTLIEISRLSLEKKRKLTITGSKSSIIFDDTKVKKIQFLKNKGINPKNTIKKPYTIFYPSYSNENPLSIQVMEFVHSVKTKERPRSGLNLALSVAKIIHLSEQSIYRKGAALRI